MPELPTFVSYNHLTGEDVFVNHICEDQMTWLSKGGKMENLRFEYDPSTGVITCPWCKARFGGEDNSVGKSL